MEAWAFESAMDSYVINDYFDIPAGDFEIYEFKEESEEGKEISIDTVVRLKSYPVAEKAEIIILCSGHHIIALNSGDEVIVRKTSRSGNPLHFEVLRFGVNEERIGHRETRRFADVKAIYPRFLKP